MAKKKNKVKLYTPGEYNKKNVFVDPVQQNFYTPDNYYAIEKQREQERRRQQAEYNRQLEAYNRDPMGWALVNDRDAVRDWQVQSSKTMARNNRDQYLKQQRLNNFLKFTQEKLAQQEKAGQIQTAAAGKGLTRVAGMSVDDIAKKLGEGKQNLSRLSGPQTGSTLSKMSPDVTASYMERAEEQNARKQAVTKQHAENFLEQFRATGTGHAAHEAAKRLGNTGHGVNSFNEMTGKRMQGREKGEYDRDTGADPFMMSAGKLGVSNYGQGTSYYDQMAAKEQEYKEKSENNIKEYEDRITGWKPEEKWAGVIDLLGSRDIAAGKRQLEQEAQYGDRETQLNAREKLNSLKAEQEENRQTLLERAEDYFQNRFLYDQRLWSRDWQIPEQRQRMRENLFNELMDEPYAKRTAGMNEQEKAELNSLIDQVIEYAITDVNKFDFNRAEDESLENMKISKAYGQAAEKGREAQLFYLNEEGYKTWADATGQTGEYDPSLIHVSVATQRNDVDPGARMKYVPTGSKVDQAYFWFNLDLSNPDNNYYENGAGVRKEFFATPDMVDTFNKLYKADKINGTNQAAAFLQGVDPYLENMFSQYKDYASRTEAEEHPIATRILSYPENLLGGFIGTAGTLASVLGVESAKNPNSGWYDLSRNAQAIRNEQNEDIDKLIVDELVSYAPKEYKETVRKLATGKGKFLLDVIDSVGDNLLAMAAAGKVTGNVASKAGMNVVQLIMSSEATSNTMFRYLEEGRDPAEAAWLSIGDGVIEWFTERVSLEALLKPDMLKTLSGSAAARRAFIAKVTAAEGSEEIAADLLNWGTDWLVSLIDKHANELEKEYNDLVVDLIENQHMDPQEASRQASKQVLINKYKEMGLSGLAGAISGGVMGISRMAKNNIQFRQSGVNISGRNMGTQDLIQLGMKQSSGSMSYEIASKLNEKAQAGKKITNLEIGQLTEALKIEASTETNKMDEALAEIAKETEGKRLSSEEISKITEAKFKEKKINPETYQKSVETLNSVAELEGNRYAQAKPQAETDINSFFATEEEQQQAKGTRTDGARGIIFTDDDNTLQHARLGSIKNGKVQVYIGDSKTATEIDVADIAKRISATNRGTAAILYAKATNPDLYSDAYTNTMLALTGREDLQNLSGTLVQDATQILYAAKEGIEMPETKLPADVAEFLYKTAKAEYTEFRAAETKGAETRTHKPGEGVATYEGVEFGTKEWDAKIRGLKASQSVKDRMNVWGAVAKLGGFEVTFTNNAELEKSGEKNADQLYGKANKNGITINIEGENYYRSGEKAGTKHDIGVTFGHEAIHYLQYNSRNGFDNLQQYVMQRYVQRYGRAALNSRLNQIMNRDGISLENAIAEFMADSLDQIMANPDVINHIYNTNKALYKDLQGWAKDMIGRVKSVIAVMKQSRSFDAFMFEDVQKDTQELAKRFNIAWDEVTSKKLVYDEAWYKQAEEIMRKARGGENQLTEAKVERMSQAQLDDTYMDAMQQSDEAAMRLVLDEAAQRSGFDTRLGYHGTTKFFFTKFDMTRSKGAIFVAYNPVLARTYTQNGEVRNVSDQAIGNLDEMTDAQLLEAARERITEYAGEQITGIELLDNGKYRLMWHDSENNRDVQREWSRREVEQRIRVNVTQDGLAEGVFQFYTRPGNQFVVDAENAKSNQIRITGQQINEDTGKEVFNTWEIANWAKANGYDSVLIRNVLGYQRYNRQIMEQYGEKDLISDFGIFFNQADVKSADLVTYDNDGKVIKPSERFNDQETDIRWSRTQLDAEYEQAVNNKDWGRAEQMLMEKYQLMEKQGLIGYNVVYAHNGEHAEIARLIKSSPEAAMKAAQDMAPKVPDNAVLIPMPPHTGQVTADTDTMILANAISEITGRPVVVALESDEHISRNQAKKNNIRGVNAQSIGMRQIAEIPEDAMPVFIDNVVGGAVTAQAAHDAIGRGITLAYTHSTRAKVQGAKYLSVTYDAEGNLIPLSQRLDPDNPSWKYSKAVIEHSEQTLENNKTIVANMGSVINLEGNEISVDDENHRTKAMDFFEKLKGVNSQAAGWINLNKQGVRDSYGHGYGPLKVLLFYSVPEVLKQGKVIAYSENRNSNEYDTAIIAAPVNVKNGNLKGNYYAGAIIKIYNDGHNKFYTHDGTAAIINKEGTAHLTAGPQEGSRRRSDSHLLVNILNELNNYNRQNGKNEYIQEERKSRANVEETNDLVAYHNNSRLSRAQIDEQEQKLLQEFFDARDEKNAAQQKLDDMKPELNQWTKRMMQARDEGRFDELMPEYKEWEKGYTQIKDALYDAEQKLKKANKAFDDYIENRDVAAEQEEIKKSGLTEAEYRRKQAVDEFGYTTDFREAGYLLPNGRMLNFTGSKGQHFGMRGEDHRSIGRIYASRQYQGGAAMMAFMRDGNIRVMAETPGIDIVSTIEPTAEQYEKIREMARRFMSEHYFNVDFTDENGYTVDSIEYDGRVNPARVVNDIKTFYDTGVAPQQSVVSQFHYSRWTEESMDVQSWMMNQTPSSLQTEDELALVQHYKDLRISMQLAMRRIDEYSDKIKKLETKATLTAEERDELTALRNRLEIQQKKLAGLEDEINQVTSSEGYAGMMYRNNMVLRDYIMGKTQDQVRQTVEDMLKEVQAAQEQTRKETEELKQLAQSQAVKTMKSYLGKSSLNKAAGILKQLYNSSMTKGEIEDRLAEIALKMASRHDVQAECEALAVDLNDKARGIRTDALQYLNGVTLNIGESGLLDYIKRNRTDQEIKRTKNDTDESVMKKAKNLALKQIRSSVRGSGVRIIAEGKYSRIREQWNDLRENNMALKDFGDAYNEEEVLFAILDFINDEIKQGITDQQSQNSLEEMGAVVRAWASNITTYLVDDPKARAQINSLMKQIAELSKKTESAAQGLDALVEQLENVVLAGQKAKAWTTVLQRDVNEAIKYYNKTAKVAAQVEKTKVRKALIEQLRSENTKKLLEQQDRFNERMKNDRKARETAQDNMALRRKINTVANRMAQRLFAETDQKNVPEEAKPLARAVLKMLMDHDSVFRKMTYFDRKQINNALERLNRMTESAGAFDENTDLNWLIIRNGDDADYELVDRVKGLIADIEDGLKEYRAAEGRGTDSLTARKEALTKVQKALSQIWSVIQARSEAFIQGKRVEVLDLAMMMEEDMENSTFKGERTGFGRRARNAITSGINWGNITPEYYFRYLKNRVMTMLKGELNSGENRSGLEAMKAKLKLQQIAEEYGFNTWDGQELHTIETGRGAVEMTTEQIMALYATWKRESNALRPEQTSHLLHGGFVLAQKEQDTGKPGREKRSQRPIKMNADQLNQLGEYLTPAQKAYVDAIVDYMSGELAELGNEASMQMYGIKKYTEQYYFPVKSWGGVLNKRSDTGVNSQNENRAAQQSFSKRIRAGANNAVEIADFTPTAMKHVVGMITYNTIGPAVESMNKVLNQQLQYGEVTYGPEGEELEDNRYKRNMRAAFQEAYGQQAYDYLMTFMKDINGGVGAKYGNTVWDKLLSVFKKSAVAGSLSVAAQQPLSYIRAAMMINPKYLAQAISPQYWKGSYAEMMAHSGVAVIKEMGKFDMAFGRTMEDFITPEGMQKKAAQVWKRISDATTALPQKMDAMTWTRMWTAVKLEQMALNQGMDYESDEFMNKVAERFNDLMRRTQVYDSTMVRSQNMRNQHPFAKTITSFMAEPTLSLNVLADAFMNIHEKGGKANAAKAVATFLLSAAAQAAVKGLFSTGRTPDKKKNREENFLYRFWYNLLNEANPLGLIPGYSQLIDVLKDGEMTDNSLSVIGKAKDIVTALSKLVLPGEEKNWYRGVEDSVGQFLQLATKVPLKNMMRDFRAMVNFLSNGQAEWLTGGSYAQRPTSGAVLKNQFTELIMTEDLIGMVNKWLGDAGYGKSSEDYYKRIVSATKAGDTAKAEEYRQFLEQGKGVSEDKISSGIRGAIKDDESSSYEERIQALRDDGMKDSDIAKWILSEYKDGKITKEEAQDLYVKANPAKTADDAYFKFEQAEWEAQTGEDVTESIWFRIDDALSLHDDREYHNAVSELKQHGYDEEKIMDHVESYFVDQYKDGKADRATTAAALKKYAGKDDESTWWKLDRIAYNKETGKDAGGGQYYRLYDAIEANRSDNIKAAVDLMLKHGMEKENIKNQIRNKYKQQYLDAKGAEKTKLMDALTKAYKAVGLTAEEALKIINGWKPKQEKKKTK